jgi:hypothetical protein
MTRWVAVVTLGVLLFAVGTATGVGASDGVTVEFDPETASVSDRDTVTLDLTARNVTRGVGAVDLTVSVARQDVADIETVTVEGDPANSDTTFRDDNSTARITGSGMDIEANESVSLARIQLRSTDPGETDVSVSVTALGDDEGSRYNISTVRSAELTVESGSSSSETSTSGPTDTPTQTETATPTQTPTQTQTVSGTTAPGTTPGQGPTGAPEPTTGETSASPEPDPGTSDDETATPLDLATTGAVAEDPGDTAAEPNDGVPTVGIVALVFVAVIAGTYLYRSHR